MADIGAELGEAPIWPEADPWCIGITAGNLLRVPSLSGFGCLYSFSTGYVMQALLKSVSIADRLAWNHEGTSLYRIDTLTGRLRAFGFHLPTMTFSLQRTVIGISENIGMQDGMTIDSRGNIWVARHGGGAVGGWDPRNGEPSALVEISAQRVSRSSRLLD